MIINLEKIKETIKINCSEIEFNPSIRLDKFLFDQFPECSRAYFQELINNGLVRINSKKITKGSYKIKKTDLIEIDFPEEKQFDVAPKKVDFEIVDTQKDFVIINKPAGLVVHHSDKTGSDEATLVNGLLYKFKELNEFEDKERPGIVHRLDKGTSGLLIIARNIKSHIKFSSMFKNREVKKTYLAIVKGHPTKTGRIDFPVGRHLSKRHLMSHLSPLGKEALTYYDVLKYYDDYSLVAVHIVTGRTHQIRVHFAAIGHGLIGDNLYGYLSKEISRPALHAWKISFDYKDQTFNYLKPAPKDFQRLLMKLNKELKK